MSSAECSCSPSRPSPPLLLPPLPFRLPRLLETSGSGWRRSRSQTLSPDRPPIGMRGPGSAAAAAAAAAGKRMTHWMCPASAASSSRCWSFWRRVCPPLPLLERGASLAPPLKGGGREFRFRLPYGGGGGGVAVAARGFSPAAPGGAAGAAPEIPSLLLQRWRSWKTRVGKWPSLPFRPRSRSRLWLWRLKTRMKTRRCLLRLHLPPEGPIVRKGAGAEDSGDRPDPPVPPCFLWRLRSRS